MKAHAMRRSIWFLNIGLAAAVVGVGAWYFLDVKDAVASTPRPTKKGKPPARWGKIVKAFHKQIDEARTDVLRAPIRLKDVEDAFKIKDYITRVPKHFIFTGALPGPVAEKVPDQPKKVNLPTGLDAVGRIAWLIWGGPNGTTIVFEFKNNQERRFFSIGDFVKASPKEPDRFRLSGANMPETDLYKIEYEVWEDGKAVVAEEPGAVVWDNRREPLAEDGVIRPVPTAQPAGGAASGTGDGVAAEAAGLGTVEGDTPDGSTQPGVVEVHPKVVVVGGEKLTAKDLKPEIKVINTRLRRILFDEKSARYFKARDTKKLIESVKTREVSLPGGKRGVQISDPGEAPADAFDLRRGDVIVSINGQPTPDRASIVRIAEAMPKNVTRISIVVDRNGRKITFDVDPRDPKTRRRAAQHGR